LSPSNIASPGPYIKKRLIKHHLFTNLKFGFLFLGRLFSGDNLVFLFIKPRRRSAGCVYTHTLEIKRKEKRRTRGKTSNKKKKKERKRG
jgi:hypothetical protein